jgi:DNA-binding SARP family transcriptional activator
MREAGLMGVKDARSQLPYSADSDEADRDPVIELRLLGGFALSVAGRDVRAPAVVQRLLVYLALHRRRQDRLLLAASLWLDTTECQARNNLRTTMWRTRLISQHLVEVVADLVRLGDAVQVDMHRMVVVARELLAPPPDDTAPGNSLPRVEPDLFGADLLPDWSEEWVLPERERVRQLRLHALENLSRRFSACGRHAEAIDAGVLAVSGEPLRESANRVLIEAHVAEGNVIEARRQYERFRALLWREVSLEPSERLRASVPGPRATQGGDTLVTLPATTL